MGSSSQVAQQHRFAADVAYGSKADIGLPAIDVRFTPKSGHVQRNIPCPLCAISGHYAVQQLMPR
jgi:hypothetical protein